VASDVNLWAHEVLALHGWMNGEGMGHVVLFHMSFSQR